MRLCRCLCDFTKILWFGLDEPDAEARAPAIQDSNERARCHGMPALYMNDI